MEHAELQEVLTDLLKGWESEVVEFKQANDDFHTDKIGTYFSALSNEANLGGRDRAWLGTCQKFCVRGQNFVVN